MQAIDTPIPSPPTRIDPVTGGLSFWRHQVDWLNDPAQFKIALKCRQVGWSTIMAYEAVRDLVRDREPWIFSSGGMRQSLELMRKAKAWARYFRGVHAC